MNIEEIKERIRIFSEERDWDQFHSPKNLSMALSAEVGELLDILQWIKEEDTRIENIEEETLKLVKEELADIFYYVIRISDKLNIHLEKEIINKMKINEQKYPVKLSKGNSKKYNRR